MLCDFVCLNYISYYVLCFDSVHNEYNLQCSNSNKRPLLYHITHQTTVHSTRPQLVQSPHPPSIRLHRSRGSFQRCMSGIATCIVFGSVQQGGEADARQRVETEGWRWKQYYAECRGTIRFGNEENRKSCWSFCTASIILFRAIYISVQSSSLQHQQQHRH